MAPGEIRVEVAYSPAAGDMCVVPVRVPTGACVRDALVASGLHDRFAELLSGGVACGVWGRLSRLDATLRDHDRVEFYRPLQVDPKEARRARQAANRRRKA